MAVTLAFAVLAAGAVQRADAGTAISFTKNAALNTGTNYSTGSLPSNTTDVLITSTTANLTLSSSSVQMESFNLNNSSPNTAYGVTNRGTSNSVLTLGNSSGFTNAYSSVQNDLIYAYNTNLTIVGLYGATGYGTLSLALASSGNFNVSSGNSLTISAAITGTSMSLTKTSAGILELSGVNTFSGAFNANGGTTYLDYNGALSAVTSVSVGTGAVLSSGYTNQTNLINDAAAVTINGTGQLILSGGTETLGSLASSSASAVLNIGDYTSGSTTYSGGITVGNSTSTTYAGTITGTHVATAGIPYTFTKIGSGTLTLSGANTFTGGALVSSGTLILGVNGALGGITSLNISSGTLVSTALGLTNAINDTASVTVNGNLDTSGGTETVGGVAGTDTGGLLTIGKSGSNNGGLTVGDNTNTSFAGVIRDGAAGTGTGYFTKQGSGRMTLTGTSTFTGTVNVNAGTLAAANTGGAALGTVTAVNVAGGGTLLFGAANQLSTTAPIALGTSAASGAAVINANTFSQGTTTSQGLGALTLKGTASLDFGTVSATGNSVVLHFGDSSANVWTSGAVLSILDYAGVVYDQTGVPVVVVNGINSDDLQFGLTATALTAAQLAQLQFVNPVGADGTQYAGTFGAAIGANGQVFAVVPEPATVLGGLLLVGALGWNQRRRLGGLAGPRHAACAA